MKTLRTILMIVTILAATSAGYALEWVPLHEKADQLMLEQALTEARRDPDSVENLYVLGLVSLNQRQPEQAREAFQRMLEQDQGSIEARWGIAETLRREHNYEMSVPILKTLTDEHPRYAPAYITLAYINYIQTDYEQTIRLTGHVINLGRRNVDTNNYLRAHGLYAAGRGMLAHYGGPIAKAFNGPAVMRHLRIIEKIAPDSPIVTFGMGSYYMLTPKVFGQDLNKAEAYLKETIAADPLFADPYVRLAQIYRARGDMEKYNELIGKALELDPGNELALDIKSRACNFICLEDVRD